MTGSPWRIGWSGLEPLTSFAIRHLNCPVLAARGVNLHICIPFLSPFLFVLEHHCAGRFDGVPWALGYSDFLLRFPPFSP